jgi:hypothetical protein
MWMPPQIRLPFLNLRDRKLNSLAACVAAVAMLLLCVRALNRFDDSWDGTAYHLVFAAFRSKLLSLDDFRPLPLFMDYYSGFPSFLDIVSGYTWRFTGSILVLQVFPLVAILVLAVFWRWRFGLSMGWTLIAILAVPVIQTSATALYVDTFTNCLFAIPVSTVSMAFIDRRPLDKSDVVISLFSLAIAANCKSQFGPLATILLVLMCAHQLPWLVQQRKRKEVIQFLAVSSVACLAILYTELRNAVLFGNPFYPVTFSIFGHALPGSVSTNAWDGPDYLRHATQPLKWLLSVLEYRAFEGLDMPYTIDQYQFIPVGFMPAPDRILPPGTRVGGFFVPYVFGLLAWLAIFVRKYPLHDGTRWFVPLVIASIIVAPLPGFHQLRYSSFWMLNLIFLCFMAARRNDEFPTAFRAFLVVMFLSVGMITGWRYFDPTPYSVQDHIRTYGIDKAVTGRDICLEYRNRDSLLFTYIFHSSGRYRVVDLPPPQHCPAASN